MIKMSGLHQPGISKTCFYHGRESRDFYGNSHEENGGIEDSIRTSFSGNSMSMHLFKIIISHAAYADLKTFSTKTIFDLIRPTVSSNT